MLLIIYLQIRITDSDKYFYEKKKKNNCTN